MNHLTRVTVVPITSTVRDEPSEVLLGVADGMRHPCAPNLLNVVTVHESAIGRSVAARAPERFREVCAALAYALGCEG